MLAPAATSISVPKKKHAFVAKPSGGFFTEYVFGIRQSAVNHILTFAERSPSNFLEVSEVVTGNSGMLLANLVDFGLSEGCALVSFGFGFVFVFGKECDCVVEHAHGMVFAVQ